MSVTTLYRFYDTQGVLLYVGITSSVPTRLYHHRYAVSKPWWQEAVRIELEHFATRPEALEAEWAAILAEHPRYNQRKRSPRLRRTEREKPVSPDEIRGYMCMDALAEHFGVSAALIYRIVRNTDPRPQGWRCLGSRITYYDPEEVARAISSRPNDGRKRHWPRVI